MAPGSACMVSSLLFGCLLLPSWQFSFADLIESIPKLNTAACLYVSGRHDHLILPFYRSRARRQCRRPAETSWAPPKLASHSLFQPILAKVVVFTPPRLSLLCRFPSFTRLGFKCLFLVIKQYQPATSSSLLSFLRVIESVSALFTRNGSSWQQE